MVETRKGEYSRWHESRPRHACELTPDHATPLHLSPPYRLTPGSAACARALLLKIPLPAICVLRHLGAIMTGNKLHRDTIYHCRDVDEASTLGPWRHNSEIECFKSKVLSLILQALESFLNCTGILSLSGSYFRNRSTRMHSPLLGR